MIPIPPPSLLGAALEDEDGATTSRVARRSNPDSGIWKSAPTAEELAEAGRSDRSDARRRPTYDGFELEAPRMSRMEMSDISADGDLFSTAPSPEEFRQKTAPVHSGKAPASSGDPWKSAGSGSRR